MSIARRVAARAGGQRAFSGRFGNEDLIPAPSQVDIITPAGIPVNDMGALKLGVLLACVRIISNVVGGLPFDSVRMKGSYRQQLDPAPPIVANPFGGATSMAGVTRRAGLAQMVVSLLLRGNAFALVVARDYLGWPTRLVVVHPDMVTVDIDADGRRVYEVNHKPVADGDMLHVMGLSMPGAAEGISVIACIRNMIGLGLAAERFGMAFFANGAHLSGVIEVEQDLKPDRVREMKETFEAGHSGLARSHAVGVLTGGAKFNPISVTPEDAQFLGTRQAQNLDVAMVLGVPPHMLGQVDRTTSWGKGIEEQKQGFLDITISPISGLFEDAWSAMLPKPQVARFNLNAFLRANTQTRYTAHMQARTASWKTINEVRADEDMPPLPGGDDLFAPLNSAHTLTTMTDPNDDDLDDDGKPAADPADDDTTSAGQV